MKKMNQLALLIDEKDFVQSVAKAVTEDVAWRHQPQGHSDIQILHFILNHQDFPTDFSRYRQVLRELWSRWEAIEQNRLERRMTQSKIEELEAEIDGVNSALRWTWMGWKRRRLEAEKIKKMAEIRYLTSHILRLDLVCVHRLGRETLVLMNEHERLLPSVINHTPEDELLDWKERAEHKQELKPYVKPLDGQVPIFQDAIRRINQDVTGASQGLPDGNQE